MSRRETPPGARQLVECTRDVGDDRVVPLTREVAKAEPRVAGTLGARAQGGDVEVEVIGLPAMFGSAEQGAGLDVRVMVLGTSSCVWRWRSGGSAPSSTARIGVRASPATCGRW